MHFLLEELKISLKSSLSTRSLFIMSHNESYSRSPSLIISLSRSPSPGLFTAWVGVWVLNFLTLK